MKWSVAESVMISILNRFTDPVVLVRVPEGTLAAWSQSLADLWPEGPANRRSLADLCPGVQSWLEERSVMADMKLEDGPNAPPWRGATTEPGPDGEPMFLRLDLVQLDLASKQAAVVLTREDSLPDETGDDEGQVDGLLDDLTAAGAFVDDQGRFEDVSAELGALMGSTPESLAGRTCAEVFPGGLGQRLEEIRNRVMTLGLDQTEKIDIVADGIHRHLEVTFNVVWVHDAISGLYFSCQDFREEPADAGADAGYHIPAEEEVAVSALKKAQLLMADDYNFNATMNRALAILGNANKVDRVHIWQFHPGPAEGDNRLRYSLAFSWSRTQAPDSPAHVDNLAAEHDLEHFLERFRSGQVVSGPVKNFQGRENCC